MKKHLLSSSIVVMAGLSASAMSFAASAPSGAATPAAKEDLSYWNDLSNIYVYNVASLNAWTQPLKPGMYLRNGLESFKLKKGHDSKATIVNTQVGYVQEFDSLGSTLGAEIDYNSGRYSFTGASTKVRNFGVRLFAHKNVSDATWLETELGVKRLNLKDKSKLKANEFNVQVAAGHKMISSNGLFVEPSLKLAYARIGSTKIPESSIALKSFNSLVGQVNLKAGKAFSRGQIWAEAGLAREFLGTTKATATNLALSRKTKQFIYDVKVGGDVAFTKSISLAASAGVQAGKYMKLSPNLSVSAHFNF